MSGLIGVGKSTTATRLKDKLEGYEILNSTQKRRDLGFVVYRIEDSQMVEAALLTDAITYLNQGKGLIYDALHDNYFWRVRKYDFAREHQLGVIVVQVICSEETAKNRILARKMEPGKFCDTNDPAKYDLVKSEWEPIEGDYEKLNSAVNFTQNTPSRYFGKPTDHGTQSITSSAHHIDQISVDFQPVIEGGNNQPHISHITYNTDINCVESIFVVPDHRTFVYGLEDALTDYKPKEQQIRSSVA